MTTLQSRLYTYWFLLPAAIVYLVFFIAPTLTSLFFSLTIWTLSDWSFTGLDNFRIFLTEPSLSIGFRNSSI
jgi:raffinose/stachyose/melibiose transport system permease protein